MATDAGTGTDPTATAGAYIAPYYYPIFDDSSAMIPAVAGRMFTPALPPSRPCISWSICRRPGASPMMTMTAMSRVTAPPQPPPKSTRPPSNRPCLVFRDGHQQQVTNYAIMGQTVYVFDNRTQKIALSDLDVPATIKLNDDRGVEFQLPNAKQADSSVVELCFSAASTLLSK